MDVGRGGVKRGSPIPFRLRPGKHKSGAPRLRAEKRTRTCTHWWVWITGLKSGVCFVRTKLSVISRQGTPISPRLRHISAAQSFFLALLSRSPFFLPFFSFHFSFPEQSRRAASLLHFAAAFSCPSLAERLREASGGERGEGVG